jgi:hypothetical protein
VRIEYRYSFISQLLEECKYINFIKFIKFLHIAGYYSKVNNTSLKKRDLTEVISLKKMKGT